jgi:hypothetical protein
MRFYRRAMTKMTIAALAMTAAFAVTFAAENTASAQRRPRKVIRITQVTIEGRIQKPQAFYILQRSNLNFEGLELKNSFVPKIIKSVDQAPF